MPPRTRTPAPDAPENPPPGLSPQAPESAEDPGGYFRNTGQVELTVLGEGATVVLAPGRITPLTRTPTHRDLAPASEADFLAQQAADASTPSTDETEA